MATVTIALAIESIDLRLVDESYLRQALLDAGVVRTTQHVRLQIIFGSLEEFVAVHVGRDREERERRHYASLAADRRR